MVKFINAVIVATIVASPALALATQEQPTDLVSREVLIEQASDLLGREITSLDDLTERDVEELQERAPFFFFKKFAKKAARGAARLAGSFLSGREFEDLDELATREPEPAFLQDKYARPGGRGRGGRAAIPSPPSTPRLGTIRRLGKRDLEDMDELSTRDLEDLEDLAAREPFRGRFRRFGGRRRFRSPSRFSERDFEDMDELDARELEDLEERFWFLKNIAKKAVRKVAGHFFGRDLEGLEELSARDLEELATREPWGFLKKFAKGAGRVAKSLFFARELEDGADLSAREPFFRSRKLKQALRGAASLASSFFQRDVQDLDELSAREYEEFEERCFAAAANRLANKPQPEFTQRSVEEALGELEARDFEEDVFEAREMEIDELD